MKKLIALMFGMALAIGSVAYSQAPKDDTTKTAKKSKKKESTAKKSKKSKKEDTTK